MDLLRLTEAAWGLLDELAPHTIPIPKLKKAVDGEHGYKPDNSVVGTKGGRPSSVKPQDDGDKTGAGVKPKSISPSDTKTGQRPSKTKTSTTKKKAPAPSGAGTKPTSCPGGGAPRMVFGKWRCTGQSSSGSTKAKSRIATKRKAGKKKPPPKGLIAKLVHKARAAFAGMFD